MKGSSHTSKEMKCKSINTIDVVVVSLKVMSDHLTELGERTIDHAGGSDGGDGAVVAWVGALDGSKVVEKHKQRSSECQSGEYKPFEKTHRDPIFSSMLFFVLIFE